VVRELRRLDAYMTTTGAANARIVHALVDAMLVRGDDDDAAAELAERRRARRDARAAAAAAAAAAATSRGMSSGLCACLCIVG
jgi:hypothetical protein